MTDVTEQITARHLSRSLIPLPFPGPVGEQAIWVRGNTDRWLADAFDSTFQPSGLPTNPPAAWFHWCAAKIGRANRDRLADTRRIISPGSVGLPYGHPGAAWALLPDVILRRTSYDTDAAAATVLVSAGDLPGIEFITGNIQASASAAKR